jgi:hypothetical protein
MTQEQRVGPTGKRDAPPARMSARSCAEGSAAAALRGRRNAATTDAVSVRRERSTFNRRVGQHAINIGPRRMPPAGDGYVEISSQEKR